MLDSLVTAYSDRDSAEIKRMLNSPFIKHMDVEFAILAKNLAEKWIEEPVCCINFIVLCCAFALIHILCCLTFRKKKSPWLKMMKMQKSHQLTLEEIFVEMDTILYYICSSIEIRMNSRGLTN